MFSALLHKLIGSKNDRELKRIRSLVAEINQLEVEFASLDMEGLRAKTGEFRTRIAEATHTIRTQLTEAQERAHTAEDEDQRSQWKEESERYEKELRQAEADALAELLPQAFAVVRETSRR